MCPIPWAWSMASRLGGARPRTLAHVEFDPKRDGDLLDQDGWASNVRGLEAEAVDLILGAEPR